MLVEKFRCVDLAASCGKSMAATQGEGLRHPDVVGFPNEGALDFTPHGPNRYPSHQQSPDLVVQIPSISLC